MVDGIAFDHGISRRITTIVAAFGSMLPKLCIKAMTSSLLYASRTAFPWLKDHPSFKKPRVMDGVPHRTPMFCHDLAENLRDGSIETVVGIQEVTGPRSVLLTDGTVLDVDAMIFCSGYLYDFSLVKGAGDPTDPAHAPDHFQRIKATRHYVDAFPRLYHGIVSEQFPESLAFLGHMITMQAPWVLNDLATMAIASLWSGAYPLPTAEEMAKDINSHYDFQVEMLNRGPIPHLGFRIANAAATNLWLNEAAGTGVMDRLATLKSWFHKKSWCLWWYDRKFYYLLMDGPDVPAVFRLFETGRPGRKAWPGARDHIIKTNEEIANMLKEWKKMKKTKKIQ